MERPVAARSPPELAQWGEVKIELLLCGRTTRIHHLRQCYLQFSSTEVTVQITSFKCGEGGHFTQIAVPIKWPTSTADTFYRLLHRLYDSALSRLAFFFGDRYGSWISAFKLRRAMLDLFEDVSTPSGTMLCAKYLRTGGISSADVVGAPLTSIMRLSNHKLAELVHRH